MEDDRRNKAMFGISFPAVDAQHIDNLIIIYQTYDLRFERNKRTH